MTWLLSHKADPAARGLADRHYNRQTPGALQFCPPGRTVVLLRGFPAAALWVAVHQRFVMHAWPGAWCCSCFRNEGGELSSGLIREAVAAVRWVWGDPPAAGFVTFVRPSAVRRKRDPGRCFMRAGWRPCGETVKGLLVFRLAPAEFGPPVAPGGLLWGAAAGLAAPLV